MKECSIGPLELCTREMVLEFLTQNKDAEKFVLDSFDSGNELIEFVKDHFRKSSTLGSPVVEHRLLQKLPANLAVLEEIFYQRRKNFRDSENLAKAYINLYFGIEDVNDFLEEITLHGSSLDTLIQATPAIDELRRILHNYLDPSASQAQAKFGVRKPRGILLNGPTGSGKSTLANAACSFCASKYEIRTFKLDPSAILSRYFGDTEANVRNAFRQLRQIAISQPVLVVVDEFLDVIGRGRRGGSFESRILSTFLNELDGIDTVELPLVVLATTQDCQQLDDALIRPGRFDHIVDVARGFDAVKFLSHWQISSPKEVVVGMKTPSDIKKYIMQKMMDEMLLQSI